MADVIIIMGSRSDLDKIAPCGEILDRLGITWKATVSSAHRSPERTAEIVAAEEAAGAKIFVCAAGMAAHLAGAVAARTVLPVVGVPIASQTLNGLDALLSTAQMPPGVPVACMSLDKAGAKNAAWLAAEILALADGALREKLLAERRKAREEVERAALEVERGV